MQGRILTIAGSDPSGGAGIQADIKSISALGGYAMSAITALTVQNSLGVSEVHAQKPSLVKAQIEAVLTDMGADCIKTGMLCNRAVIKAVVAALSQYPDIPIVVDPVISATSGHRLLDEEGLDYLIHHLFPKVTLLTPNLDEAALLSGMDRLENLDHMRRAAEKLMDFGPGAVLIKGGHLKGDMVQDLLVSRGGERIFSSPRIESRHCHGTGCSLASAIATGIAQGLSLEDAVGRAHDYVHQAILMAPGFGQGRGPLNHLISLD